VSSEGRGEGRKVFLGAAAFFVDLVARVPGDRWDAPGLGVWSVRELTGHAGRALSTITEYLAAPPAPSDAIPDAVAYYESFATAGPELAAAVAERGREAGAALGENPAAAIAGQVRTAVAALDANPDDRLVTTRGGGMRLGAYLPTRTFELVVHGLDLATAAGVDAVPPEDALRAALHLAADLAVGRGLGGELCLAVTGRREWPRGLSVI
jgi:uncharacterized protein (TIGR03083 family)